jgi:hypothetical protein
VVLPVSADFAGACADALAAHIVTIAAASHDTTPLRIMYGLLF